MDGHERSRQGPASRRPPRCLRDLDVQGCGGFEVDGKLQLRGLLNGEIAGLGALGDPVHVGGSTLVGLELIDPIPDEPARFDVGAGREHHGDSGLGGQLDGPRPKGKLERVGQGNQGLSSPAPRCLEGGLELRGFLDREDAELDLELTGGGLGVLDLD